MSRFAFMVRHPKRSLAVLALLLAATAVTIGSGANFSATSANPTNTFTAGTLTIGSNPANGTAVFAPGTPMKPGDSRVGIVDIQNTGSISGDFTLSATSIVNTPAAPGLTSRLTIQVEDCGLWTSNNTVAPACAGTTIPYPAGAIGLLTAKDVGTFAGGNGTTTGDKHRYKITVAWPNGTPAQDDPLQGAQTTFTLKWDAQ